MRTLLKKHYKAGVVAAFTLALGLSALQRTQAQGMMPPFGTPGDVKYASSLWKAIEKANLIGPNAVNSVLAEGKAPHGKVIETVSAKVKVDGHEGVAHVKRNYGGSIADVSANRAKNLMAITVMFQREKGYDAENKDWFWAKYMTDGSLDKGPKDMPLAGRVAKGMDMGCIACHKNAPGGDLLFLPL